MALLLAPYNDAMRLGMGFNSFTQQLCVNDAVRLAGGKQETATEKSLRPQYQPGLMTAPDGSNVDISQDVTWTAKFVNKMSEVTDSLNISGSLQIKLEAIGGGVKASASFLDSNKFKESDINYFFQVRVTNQRVTAPDLTDFAPIPNVPFSEFNRVYGDSFISGFIEGGEFNALISIKLRDHSTASQVKGDLEAQMRFGAVEVSGAGSVDKESMSSNIDGETTIAVSWRGGGDIKDATVTDWTLDTLKRVAMEFPEHLMACPIRTHAILTKYTGLKSFYEQSIKGSPLDYENAGVYSSALLDAYMDYKVMWRSIQQAASEVENGQSTLTAKDALPELADLKTEAKAYYEKQLGEYQQKQRALQAAPTTTDPKAIQPAPQQTAPVVPAQQALPDAPMPPNNIVPLQGKSFRPGRSPPRLQVDAVASDPKIACDPSRTCQYLSPAVFRLLIPTVTKVNKSKEAEAAAAAAAKALESETQLNQLKTENAKLQKQVADAAAFKSQVSPYDGWCPVKLNTPIRIRSVLSKKCVTWLGAGTLNQHNIGDDPYQKASIHSQTTYISACLTCVWIRKFLATSNTTDGGVDLTFGPFPTFFVFEDMKNGATMIHIAEVPNYTLNIWGASMDDGARVFAWKDQPKGENDKWYIKDFADHSI
ncbi:Major facilitator superfamily MFS-1 [Mycena sanguinolenta]|uniref:Major facilitator superfamily MFS-1 n=1 Tax=Mycena sanguinolenta TaxID=230812 RepID=A0A8H6XUE1_9AGAR|nr:Major facilitator superfamily MFS-1 [Mycena sanguinolenta]